MDVDSLQPGVDFVEVWNKLFKRENAEKLFPRFRV
jgi:hypothetical protein